MSITAMKQALEALEELNRTGDTQVFDLCYAPKVIPALRLAIEQAERQEPVAWMSDVGSVASAQEKKMGYVLESAFTTPLYTSPPAQRKPLTDGLPCCGYTDATAIKWNEFNHAVQCHNCGHTYTQTFNKPLTLDYIDQHIGADEGDREAVVALVREVEAAHGIKGGV